MSKFEFTNFYVYVCFLILSQAGISSMQAYFKVNWPPLDSKGKPTLGRAESMCDCRQSSELT